VYQAWVMSNDYKVKLVNWLCPKLALILGFSWEAG
jgi:hypothetical protein